MKVNFRAELPSSQTHIPDSSRQNQKIDGRSSSLKINTVVPEKKSHSNSFKDDFKKNVFIAGVTVPVLLGGVYTVAIRGAGQKFFIDAAQNSKKTFKPLIDGLKGKIAEVTIKTQDNLKLKCWDINPSKSDKYVIVLHGNNQNIQVCQELYSTLHKKGYGVFALEYRGYAENPGNVSERGFYKDADAALKYLKDKGIKEEKIGLVGYSLGGAVATDLASRNNLGAVILTSTFNNAIDVARAGVNASDLKIPSAIKKTVDSIPGYLFPIHNSYRSDLKISKINSPITIIHSEDDKDIPINLAQKLSKKATNSSNLTFVTLPTGGHDFDKDKIKAISDALDEFSF